MVHATPIRSVEWLTHRMSGAMSPGAVLFHAPSHSFQARGGGEVQLLQTARHLDALGIEIRPFVPWVDRIENAKLIHLFGLSREGLELARLAKSKHIPIVLSPISWYEPAAILALANSAVAAGLELTRWLVQRLMPRLPRWKRSLLLLADMILPNSVAEGEQLLKLFRVDPLRIRPVPNGVDDRFGRASAEHWRARHGSGPFVLYSGRIEPRKNVLGLVRATRSLGLPLVVIGASTPGCESYAERCQEAAGEVHWVGGLEPDDPLLISAYASARVLALPSWFETPGLAALEAAAAGTSVVVTPYGSAREYFGDRVAYARPDRPEEVTRAIETAWRVGPDPELSRHVLGKYSWTNVARRTAEVYDHVLG